VKKLLAAAAVLASAIAVLPVAPAGADSVCAPVTIDGQPVCQDLTPVEQAVATAEATALAVIGIVLEPVQPELGYAVDQEQCVRSVPHDSSNVVAVDVVEPYGETLFSRPSSPYYRECRGNEVTIPAVATTPGTVQHVHVPEICLTTTGTCAGPVDQDVQMPPQTSPVRVCTQPERIWFSSYSDEWGWHRDYLGPIACTQVSQ